MPSDHAGTLDPTAFPETSCSFRPPVPTSVAPGKATTRAVGYSAHMSPCRPLVRRARHSLCHTPLPTLRAEVRALIEILYVPDAPGRRNSSRRPSRAACGLSNEIHEHRFRADAGPVGRAKSKGGGGATSAVLNVPWDCTRVRRSLTSLDVAFRSASGRWSMACRSTSGSSRGSPSPAGRHVEINGRKRYGGRVSVTLI